MSGYCKLADLHEKHNIIGLNIEGYRPTLSLPDGCKWYNAIQAIDEPLNGIDFNKIMSIVEKNRYEYLEQAIEGLDIDKFVYQLVELINAIKKANPDVESKNILVHIHQYSNSTVLNYTLQGYTEVRCITDRTNFFESPVDYKKQYPDIKILISLSQCASMGNKIKAGTWMIADSFMEFNVKNNVVYTDPIRVKNSINEIKDLDILLPHIRGNILIVDDLWNPDLDVLEGVLLIDKEDSKVLDFVKENTKIFDWSHNWEHAVKVAYNSTRIRNSKFILYLALLHDVCDHKYLDKGSIKREVLTKYIEDELKGYEEVDGLIDKVSFSKSKDIKSNEDNKREVELAVVQDADRLEAIGEVGITRCEQVVKMKAGEKPISRDNIVKNVIIHCFDKLLRLVPEGFIRNKDKETLRRHNVIVKYVQDNLPKTDLKYESPKLLNFDK